MLKDLKQFPGELKKRSPTLFYFGIAFLILFGIFLVGFLVCQYNLYDICHWLKPWKFSFSFAIYLFTVGWYLYYLRNNFSGKTLQAFSWIICLLVSLEMTLIFAQSVTASDLYQAWHIPPQETQFWSEKFSILANILILATSGLTLFIGLQFFRDLKVHPLSYLWSIRVAFILFVMSAMIGLFLLFHSNQSAPDPKSLGLPFTQLSQARSNLVSMHFIGIHSMQLLPFLVYYLNRYVGKNFLFATLSVYSILSLFFILRM